MIKLAVVAEKSDGKVAEKNYSSNTPKSFFTRGGVRTSSDRADLRRSREWGREKDRAGFELEKGS
jgi:hypothetical protein